jgi:hypothetical protein
MIVGFDLMPIQKANPERVAAIVLDCRYPTSTTA